MTVRAILDAKGRQVVSIGADAKVSSAVKILSERRIGAVLVMAGGKIEGIISERDIVRVLGERGAEILDEPVRTVMTAKVMTCRRSDTVSSADGEDDGRKIPASSGGGRRPGDRAHLDRRRGEASRDGIRDANRKRCGTTSRRRRSM